MFALLWLPLLVAVRARPLAAQTAPPPTSAPDTSHRAAPHTGHAAPRERAPSATRDSAGMMGAHDHVGTPRGRMGAMPGMTPVGAPATAHAMGPGMQAMMSGPLGLPMTRTGSGTAWVPDSTPMYARMFEAGSWGLMFHGVAFGQYDHQGGPRGANQVGSVNWGMLMAAHNLGAPTPDGASTGGRLQVRGMMSLEPFTVGSRGYPLLLQTGEAYQGQPLHDRQHPHDLFMELGALYEKQVARNLGLQLYAAPVGEPALGPVAFPHRPSASADPFATLGHHWEDATHISFGVLTAGLFTRTVKLEGSIFNGREPDQIRTNFDYKGRSLDSYAGRLSVNPSPFVSLSAAYGYLKSPEALHPEESVHRTTLSALYGHPFGAEGAFSASALYGVNTYADAPTSPSGGVEALLAWDATNSVFARVEQSRKSAEDLALPVAVTLAGTASVPSAGTFDPSQQFSVGSLSLGYVREVVRGIGVLRGASLGLGVEGTLNRVPASLESTYGSRTPRGFAVYLRLRPSRMAMGTGAMHMGAMRMTTTMPAPGPEVGRISRPADTTGMHGMMTDDQMRGMPMPAATTRPDSASRAVPPAAAAAPAASTTAAPASRPTVRPAARDSMPGMSPKAGHGGMPGMNAPGPTA
ncbi:MAG TPA: hypothetical protein VGD56_07375 [Gemmatirosa sp.]